MGLKRCIEKRVWNIVCARISHPLLPFFRFTPIKGDDILIKFRYVWTRAWVYPKKGEGASGRPSRPLSTPRVYTPLEYTLSSCFSLLYIEIPGYSFNSQGMYREEKSSIERNIGIFFFCLFCFLFLVTFFFFFYYFHSLWRIYFDKIVLITDIHSLLRYC